MTYLFVVPVLPSMLCLVCKATAPGMLPYLPSMLFLVCKAAAPGMLPYLPSTPCPVCCVRDSVLPKGQCAA